MAFGAWRSGVLKSIRFICFSHNAVCVFARDYLNSAAVFEILKNGHEFLIFPQKIASAARAEKLNIVRKKKTLAGRNPL